MKGYAYFSKTHVETGGGVYRYRKENGDFVDATAFSKGQPWSKDAYFEDAQCLGEVVDFVRVVEKPRTIKKDAWRMI